jgi:plastocyanin
MYKLSLFTGNPDRLKRYRLFTILAVGACLFAFTASRTVAATVMVDVGPGANKFDPQTVNIDVGDTVEWTWSSNTHSVTSGDPVTGTADGLFDSGVQDQPFTFSYTFTSPGTFDYYCIPHRLVGMIGTVNVAGATPSPSPTVSPTPSPSPTASPSPSPSPTPTTLANISTRLDVETGDNVLIGGFIITGTQPKKVILRAIGPSLPVAGALANPTLELNSGGTILALNDNWMDAPNKQEIIDSTIPPNNDLESAILTTLNPGLYTAIVRGVNNTTGVGLVEAYDLDRTVDSKLANISTRGLVQTGDNVLIGGFIVLGSDMQKVIVRAIGPSLPVAGALADPTLDLVNPDGSVLASNDNWRDTQEADIIATGVPPTDDAESAIVATLSPNLYTAIVRGANGTTGVGLVEVFALAP